MSSVALIKAFWGIVETVELHSDETSAWASLREYVGAPDDATLDDWWHAWGATDPPAWYDHSNYGDCRILHCTDPDFVACGTVAFEQAAAGCPQGDAVASG